jgi:uncharacterized protein YndB with AHSA1/START domain
MQMWFTGEYLEVVEHRRLVYTEVVSDETGQVPDGPGAHDVTEVRVELTAMDGRTRLTLTHVGVPVGSPGAAGWTMAFDKLASALAT